MHLINNYQYHVAVRRWDFLVNGAIASNLIKATLFDDQYNQYRYRQPFINEASQIFLLLGDGNLITTIDGLLHEFAYKIIQNVQTFQTYVILSTVFSSEFELVKNNFN
jgi:hypothetical protein